MNSNAYLRRIIAAALGLVAVGCVPCRTSSDYALRALQVNRLDEPGDVTAAVFSWKADSARTGARQTAYRIVVDESRVTDGKTPLRQWDSGWVKSSDAIEIPYAGQPLKSATKYVWRVEVEDEVGAIAFAASFFTTALLESNAWEKAVFIAQPITKYTRQWNREKFGHVAETNRSSLLVRRVYTNEAEVASAMWFTTAGGVYETYVNSGCGTHPDTYPGASRAGREFLKPGYTQAIRRRQATGEDVTALMRRGKGETNEFSALVTDGWWRDSINCSTCAQSCFAGVLVVRFTDGSEKRYYTDTTWSAALAGPVNTACIFDGEVYDARHEGETVSWMPAQPVREVPGGKIPWQVVRPRQGPSLRLREDLVLKPVGATFPLVVKAGTTNIFDFGQNAAAVPRFRWRAKRDVKVTVKTSEMLNDDGNPKRGNDGPPGTLMRKNLRSALSRIVYWFKDGEPVTYRPNFTYFGYRYISVEADGDLELLSVESVPVSSVSAAMEKGTLVTGDSDVNRLFLNCLWGLRSNYVSVPTDCPQRDERRGWAGDAQVFAPAASYLCDPTAFLDKWIDDMCDMQRYDGDMAPFAPWATRQQQAAAWVTEREKAEKRGEQGIAQFGWDDAVIFIPREMALRFGDRRIFERHRHEIERYFDFAYKTRYATPKGKFQWGDWLATITVHGPYTDYLGYCHLILDAQALYALTREEKFRTAEETVRAEARARFLEADGLPLKEFRESQTALAFGLKAGLPATEAARRATVKLLLDSIHRKNLINTGFLGTGIIMDVVTDLADSPETAYALLLQHQCPSWLYSVDQGATTMWERWDSYTKRNGFANPGMNSFNHYSFGAVSAWMFSTMAGIRPDPQVPGYRHFFLTPRPDRRVGRCEATFDSPAGLIRSAWSYGADGRLAWTFTIPPNTTATVQLPGGEAREYAPGTYVK